MSLLPALDLPRISHRERLSERATRGLDALLAIVPERAQQKLFAQLPESERWRRLYEEGGFDALVPLLRQCQPRTPGEVLALAEALKR